jgi:hypothetical protein
MQVWPMPVSSISVIAIVQVVFAGAFVALVRFIHGDLIFAVEPSSQVDQAAAVGAEGEGFGSFLDRLFAGGTAEHCGIYG